MANEVALVVGSTGIVGLNLADSLARRGWTVFGLARKPGTPAGIRTVAADLLDPKLLTAALQEVKPTHVFFTTWMRQPTEAENIRVNSAMVRNLLDAVSKAKTVRHVALVTGLKHYLGPFESYGKGVLPATPFREEQGRLDVENFYYAQEDELFEAAAREGFGWSVHRPHTIIGYAVGNAMNMGVTLAAYATICRETGRPFLFPGSAMQWNGLTDMTDARLLARHLQWAATTPAARDNASTSSMETSFAGAGCGNVLRHGSTSNQRHFPVLGRRSKISWPMPLLSGPISPRNSVCAKRNSTCWHLHGTRTPILGVRSRS